MVDEGSPFTDLSVLVVIGTDDHVGEAVPVHITGRRHRVTELGEGLARFERRESAFDDVKDIGAPGVLAIAGGAYDEVEEAIAVNIACWGDVPSEIVVTAFPGNRDIGSDNVTELLPP